MGFSSDSKKAYEKAGSLSTESVGQIRTILSFTREEERIKKYALLLEEPKKNAIKKAHISGVAYGASQFCNNAFNCLAYWYGAKLVDEREWSVSQSVLDSQCINNRILFFLSSFFLSSFFSLFSSSSFFSLLSVSPFIFVLILFLSFLSIL